MTTEGNMEYAAARVQAQHGRLPAESDWQQLEASQDLAHYLDSARAGPLSAWVSSFDPGQDPHVLERSLRTQWKGHVERAASWHPRPWQPWLNWLAWLPSLPLLAPLAAQRERTEAAPAWLLSDLIAGPVARGAALPVSLEGSRSGVAGSPAGHTALAARWRARWDALAPQADADSRVQLARLSRAIDQHAAALPAARHTQAARRELVQRLNVLFRLSSGTAIASACHLGRLLLELERLRGGLAARSLLGPVAGGAAF
jgi:hypothetical protein